MSIYVASISIREIEFGLVFIDRRAFTTYSAAKKWIKERAVEDDTSIVEDCGIITMTLEE